MKRDHEVEQRHQFEAQTVIRFWGGVIKRNDNECVKVIEEAIFDRKFEDNEFVQTATLLINIRAGTKTIKDER